MATTQLDNNVIATDIRENIFRPNSFIDQVVIDDIYATHALRNKTIQVSQIGTLPEVTIDSTSDLSLASNDDARMEYDVHTYQTAPILVRNFEEYFTDYHTQQNITTEQASQLKEAFTKHSMHLWGKQIQANDTNRKLFSTGTRRNTSVGSGQRKAITFNDLLSVRKQLIRDGGDQRAENYFGILNAEMYADLLKLDEVKNGNHRLHSPTIAGAVTECMGFTLFLREDLPRFSKISNRTTLLELDATASSTTLAAGVFFHKKLVRRAICSNVSVFLEVSAGRGGVELSTELLAGSSLARTDNHGCVLLLEDL